MIKKQIAIMVSILGVGVMVGASQVRCAQQMPAPKPVAYCRIVAQSAKYDQQILETEGIYGTGMEFRGFYSLSCPEWRNVSWVDYSDVLHKRTSPQMYKRMEKLLDADGRVRIVAVLRFDGPKKVKIAPGTPAALAAAIRATDSRYGHMNQFNYRVVLLKIIRVSPVSLDAPWPTTSKGADQSKP